MTDVFDEGKARAAEAFTRETRPLTPDGAAAMRNKAAETVREMELSAGYFVVFDRERFQLTSEAYGNAKEANARMALLKAETALNYQRSTRLMKEYIEKRGLDRTNFGDLIRTLFGGGVAFFQDRELKIFAGVAAFSGGTELQDEEVCVRAITAAGLHADIPPVVPQVLQEALQVPQAPQG
ncbi:MAG: hypothetical protein ACD_37C00148G0002 [uncultured bacterium]|nr:MAG: hypothetical protein ACD_37C00148G0002 [uncultured bacterium]